MFQGTWNLVSDFVAMTNPGKLSLVKKKVKIQNYNRRYKTKEKGGLALAFHRRISWASSLEALQTLKIEEWTSDS
jgi:hypothetical protein